MPVASDLPEHVAELLAPLGQVVARRMFGGYGLYLGGAMFGLIADGSLYLKVDDANRAAFEAAGSTPFSYLAKGERRTIGSFWQAPGEMLEARDTALTWARGALGAALRASAAKRTATGARRGKTARGKPAAKTRQASAGAARSSGSSAGSKPSRARPRARRSR